MPKAVAPEMVSRIQALATEGKSTREIARETGVGKSSVARYVSSSGSNGSSIAEAIEIRPLQPLQPSQQESKAQADMPLDGAAARDFLSDIGVAAPAATLPVRSSSSSGSNNPLKGDPKAIRLAESLLGGPLPAPRAPRSEALVRIVEPPVTAQAVPRADAVDPALLISQIQMNVENFGPLLKNIVQPDAEAFMASLYSKSLPELTMLLKVIEKTRFVGNLTNQFKHLFWMGTSAVEMGTQLMGLQSQGLSQALRAQDEEIQMILKEMALERADSFATAQRPEVRLGFLVSTTLLSVDAMNRARALRQPVAQATDKAASAPASSGTGSDAPPPGLALKESSTQPPAAAWADL